MTMFYASQSMVAQARMGEVNVPIAISLVICLMAVGALLCQSSLWRRYRKAQRQLASIRDQLIGSVDLSAVKQACGEGLGEELHAPRLSPLAAFFNHAFRRGTEFQPAAAAEWTREREGQLARSAFVRWVLHTALVMGLAGTFFAFMQLISGSGLLEALAAMRNPAPASVAVPVDSYGLLSTAFTNVYQGFGQAFLASLTGLASTVLLGFFNTMFVGRTREACLGAMEDFGEEVLRPLLAPTVNPADELADALRGAAGVLSASSETVGALDETTKLLGKAARRFEQSQGANSQLATTLTQLAQELAAARSNWDLLRDALRQSKRDLDESMVKVRQEAVEQRNLTQSAMREATTAMRDLGGAMAAEVQKIVAAKTDHLHAVQNEVRGLIIDSRKDWEKASDAVLSRTDAGFQAALAAVAQSQADGRKDTEAARVALGEIAGQTTRAVREHQEVLQGHTEAVATSLREWANAPAQLAEVVRVGGESLDRLNTVLGEVGQMPARWEKRVLTPLAQLGGKLDEANNLTREWNGTEPFWARWWKLARRKVEDEGGHRP